MCVKKYIASNGDIGRTVAAILVSKLCIYLYSVGAMVVYNP
jgi:hypothetical protein